MVLSLWRERVVPVTVTLTDLAILIVDEVLRLVVNSLLATGSLRLGLSLEYL